MSYYRVFLYTSLMCLRWSPTCTGSKIPQESLLAPGFLGIIWIASEETLLVSTTSSFRSDPLNNMFIPIFAVSVLVKYYVWYNVYERGFFFFFICAWSQVRSVPGKWIGYFRGYWWVAETTSLTELTEAEILKQEINPKPKIFLSRNTTCFCK